MKLQKKLMIAPSIILTMQALSFVALLWVFHGYKSQSVASHERLFSSFETISNVHLTLAQQHANLYRTVAISSSLDEQSLKTLLEQRKKMMESLLMDIKREADFLPSETMSDIFQKFEDQSKKYENNAEEAIDMATIDANTGIAAMQGSDATFKEIDATLLSAIDLIKKNSEGNIVEFEKSTEQKRLWVGLLALISGGASIAFSWFTQRQVVRDINISVQATRSIASGQLDVQLESDRSDELGDMVRSLGAMVKHLHGTIELVQETAAIIAAGSKEIAGNNQELKNRTENQVVSLEQTVDAMKRITGTVNQNADSAFQANQLAESASEIATKGGIAVSQVVATMESINESAKKIVDIVSVIDSIAFQTNILALNAAVEAARAGVHGKGFAVVAAEVRGLAQRSALAAKDIKNLIGNSVEKVDIGSVLVDQAGATMNEIVASVKHVAQILSEISAASQEQRSGIEKINMSMGEIDESTQENRVLVAQTATAAVSLLGRVSYLTKAIGSFKLDQRALPRKPLASHGKLNFPGGVSLDMQTIDISSTGIGFVLEKSVQKGQQCELVFEMPVAHENHRVETNAQVAYCVESGAGKYKVGMKFMGMESDMADLIARFLDSDRA